MKEANFTVQMDGGLVVEVDAVTETVEITGTAEQACDAVGECLDSLIEGEVDDAVSEAYDNGYESALNEQTNDHTSLLAILENTPIQSFSVFEQEKLFTIIGDMANHATPGTVKWNQGAMA